MTPRTLRILALLAVMSWSALAVGVAYLTGVGLAPGSETQSQRIAGPRAPAPGAGPAVPKPRGPMHTADVDTERGSDGGPMEVVGDGDPAGPRRGAGPVVPAAAATSEPEPPGVASTPNRPPQPRSPGPQADPPSPQPPIPTLDPGDVVDEIPQPRPDGDHGPLGRPHHQAMTTTQTLALLVRETTALTEPNRQ